MEKARAHVPVGVYVASTAGADGAAAQGERRARPGRFALWHTIKRRQLSSTLPDNPSAVAYPIGYRKKGGRGGEASKRVAIRSRGR